MVEVVRSTPYKVLVDILANLMVVMDKAQKLVKMVTLVVPGVHADKRFIQIAGEQSYAELLDAGVSIMEYQVSMMHAKVVTVDGVIATVGSCNLNQRSMQHDEEANVVVIDPKVVAELDAQLANDLEHSTEIDPVAWSERRLSQRFAERAANVVERWL